MPGADWERQIESTAAAYRQMSERVSQILVTSTSPDGSVRVTVSASGVLTDLRLPSDTLAAQIVACIRDAQARIPDLMRTAMLETVGPQDPNMHLVLASAKERFAPVARVDKDDWDERPVLEDIGGSS
ncbi:YbaB/EbfC family nucleoid-associated protein [Kibdelosporangium philippinense]|uniref:YbaB/EbfC family nucleoid-associated protein n=1 Tax=Kibdelosporangium philippinense TaxID=211113 RepID=A0ABS8ZPA9_9PSEU|nr:YbaB/EbfC family nucleoid-associated protein [Kibdelosporangium philippinense]MCE7008313.1 YbaB/EbfC family nucleoid-associated protein [Kibdelosporangium philippinense]